MSRMNLVGRLNWVRKFSWVSRVIRESCVRESELVELDE